MDKDKETIAKLKGQVAELQREIERHWRMQEDQRDKERDFRNRFREFLIDILRD